MVLIAPSLLSANKEKLKEEVRAVEKAGADWLHIDVMDGEFVENKTIFLDPKITAAIRKYTKLPLDVHLMVEHPEQYIPAFVKAGADIITVHVESKGDIHKAISMIKKAKKKAGIVLNPATTAKKIYGYIDDVDLVVVMTVVPGKGGQEYIDEVTPKIKEIKEYLMKKGRDIPIEIDGGVKKDNHYKPLNAGAEILVSGSGIFKEKDYAEVIRNMKNNLLIGSDHGGYALKQELMQELDRQKIAYEDVGCNNEESCDYPDYAKKVAEAVSKGKVERGILMCGTGIGMSIMANRYKGVRATMVYDENTAELSRKHNNSNILVLGGRTTKPALAKKILKIWLETPFEGGRHKRRVEKLG